VSQLNSTQLQSLLCIGADFHGAVVATAPGEKLLIGRRPVRNWTRRHSAVRYQACFYAENYIYFYEIQQKLLPPLLQFLTPICTKSFVNCGYAPEPTGGSLQCSPDPLAVFRGPTSKGTGEEEMGGEGRDFVLCARKSAPMLLWVAVMRSCKLQLLETEAVPSVSGACSLAPRDGIAVQHQQQPATSP